MINILGLMTFILMLCWLFDIFRKFYNDLYWKWKHDVKNVSPLEKWLITKFEFKE